MLTHNSPARWGAGPTGGWASGNGPGVPFFCPLIPPGKIFAWVYLVKKCGTMVGCFAWATHA